MAVGLRRDPADRHPRFIQSPRSVCFRVCVFWGRCHPCVFVFSCFGPDGWCQAVFSFCGSLRSLAAAVCQAAVGPLSDRCPTTCRTPPLSLSLQLLLHGVTHHLAVLLVEGVGATHAGVLLEV